MGAEKIVENHRTKKSTTFCSLCTLEARRRGEHGTPHDGRSPMTRWTRKPSAAQLALASLAVSHGACDAPRVAGTINLGPQNGQVISGVVDGLSVLVPPPGLSDERASLDTLQLSDGIHRVDLTVLDRSGNTGTTALYFDVQNGAREPPRFTGRFVEAWASSGEASTRFIGRASHGAVAADFDGDGLLDLLAWDDISFHMIRQSAPWVFQQLEWSNERVTAAGVADLDRDGDPDVIAVGERVHVLENRSGLLFERRDIEASMHIPPLTTTDSVYDGVTFTDLDADGLVDIAIGGFSCSGLRSYVLHNEGGLVFRDVAAEMGLEGFGTTVFALAMDRPDPSGDLHVWTMYESCAPFGPAHAVFQPAEGLPTATSRTSPIERGAYMGSAYLDANNDGVLDLWLSETIRNPLYAGPAYGTDSSRRAGLEALPDESGSHFEQWAMVTLDADLDGHTDVLVTQAVRWGTPASLRPHPRLMRRVPHGVFRDVSALAGLAEPREGCQSAYGADLDADGDTDLVLGCAARTRILRNDLVAPGRGRTIALHGTVSNIDGIDAHIDADGGEHRLSRGGGQPYAGGVVRESLALGNTGFRVTWPSGITQTVAGSDHAVIDVHEPEVFDIEPRRIAAGGSARIEVTVRPAVLGTPEAAVRVDASDPAWSAAMLHRDPDGAWRGSLAAPAASSTVVFTVRVGAQTFRVRPRVYVR